VKKILGKMGEKSLFQKIKRVNSFLTFGRPQDFPKKERKKIVYF